MNRSLLIFPLFFALLNACDSKAPVAKFIVIDQKTVLTDWPDSLYVAELDSILALEPIKKTQITTNITMNTHAMPIFKLPPSVSGKKDNTLKNGYVRKAESKSMKFPQTRPAEKGNPSGHEAEAFADRFTDGLSKLQSDPNNPGLYRIVTALEGDDVMKLIRRTYGSGAAGLPRFLVVGSLKPVNPGINLESLNAGDKVRIPRI